MSTDRDSIKIPDETMSKIQEKKRYGESQDETIDRLLTRGIEGDIDHSKLMIFSFVAAVLWLLSLALIDTTISNLVGGFYISTVLFWTIWMELQ